MIQSKQIDNLIEFYFIQETLGLKIAALLRKLPNDPSAKAIATKYYNLLRAMSAKGPSLVKPEVLKGQMVNVERQADAMLARV